jgi:hypothetical protein
MGGDGPRKPRVGFLRDLFAGHCRAPAGSQKTAAPHRLTHRVRRPLVRCCGGTACADTQIRRRWLTPACTAAAQPIPFFAGAGPQTGRGVQIELRAVVLRALRQRRTPAAAGGGRDKGPQLAAAAGTARVRPMMAAAAAFPCCYHNHSCCAYYFHGRYTYSYCTYHLRVIYPTSTRSALQQKPNNGTFGLEFLLWLVAWHTSIYGWSGHPLVHLVRQISRPSCIACLNKVSTNAAADRAAACLLPVRSQEERWRWPHTHSQATASRIGSEPWAGPPPAAAVAVAAA